MNHTATYSIGFFLAEKPSNEPERHESTETTPNIETVPEGPAEAFPPAVEKIQENEKSPIVSTEPVDGFNGEQLDLFSQEVPKVEKLSESYHQSFRGNGRTTQKGDQGSGGQCNRLFFNPS
jgi:hypothetical protein